MTEKPKETPKEELECPKKYVYDTGIIFECKDNIKVEIIGEEVVDLLNELNDENEYYKSIFFELVETALTDKNCRELYCKGILGIFDKANSLNQARDMIKEHMN